MRVLERLAIGAGLVVMGITAVYRYVLSDEQRAGFQEAASVVRSATHDITDSIRPIVSSGPTHAEEEAISEANRARTAAQWEALGY